jgi:hypothetical protein
MKIVQCGWNFFLEVQFCRFFFPLLAIPRISNRNLWIGPARQTPSVRLQHVMGQGKRGSGYPVRCCSDCPPHMLGLSSCFPRIICNLNSIVPSDLHTCLVASTASLCNFVRIFHHTAALGTTPEFFRAVFGFRMTIESHGGCTINRSSIDLCSIACQP